MTIPKRLLDGYTQFREGRFAEQAELYAKLATGQAPETMVIACADSRADPAMIFSANPGELFVVRNVANIVPPRENKALHQSVSSALEYAVLVLKIKHVVVLGHAGCGGIAACLGAKEKAPPGEFIAPWVELAVPARERVLKNAKEQSQEELQLTLELASIEDSLANLMSFEFVDRAVKKNELTLHGAWFSIQDGSLYWRHPEADEFRQVAVDP